MTSDSPITSHHSLVTIHDPDRINNLCPTLILVPTMPLSSAIFSGDVSYHDAMEEMASPGRTT